MEGAAFWGLAILAATMVGLSKGGLPIVGMMSVPILAVAISPLQAAGLLMPIYIVSDWFGLYAYRNCFDRRVLAIMAPAAAMGVFIGWATASLVSEAVVGGVIGLLGASFALMRLFGSGAKAPARPAHIVPGVICGAASGFTSFVSHAGAPPYQIYTLPLRLPKAVFAGTSTLLFTWINALKLPAYWSLGMVNLTTVPIALWLMLPAAFAVFAGVHLVRVLPEQLFFKLVLWALFVLSCRLIWTALPI